MKLDFEIAVDQQTRASYRTFVVVPESGCPPVPTNFGIWPPNFFEDLNQKSASNNKGFFLF